MATTPKTNETARGPALAQAVPTGQGHPGLLPLPPNVVRLQMQILDKPEPVQKKPRGKRGAKR